MKTLFVGHKVFTLDKIASTNTFAKELLSGKIVEDGTVVVARNQTDGRGRRDKTWQSSEGKNLLASIIFYPSKLLVQDQFILTIVVSLGIRKYLEDTLDKEVKIKWPNDIFIEGKKICGILIENILAKNRIKTSVIGIGLNVNQNDFPGLPNAISMKSLSDIDYNLNDVLKGVCRAVEASYIRMDDSSLIKLYINHLYMKGQIVRVRYKLKEMELTIVGVNRSGRLLLSNEEDQIVDVDMDEIEFVDW